MPSSFNFLLGLIIGGTGLLSGGGRVLAAQDLAYRITRDGREIGSYRFSIEDRPGRREVAVAMTIKVRLLFFTVYGATHQRHEVWADGRLESCTGTSVYNGNPYDLALTRQDGRYLWRVNGETQELTGPVTTFVPWKPDVAGEVTRLSEKGRAERVSIDFVRRETLPQADRPIEADKYQVTSRHSEELWYDPQGLLQRVRYERNGAVIEFRLMPPSPAPGGAE